MSSTEDLRDVSLLPPMEINEALKRAQRNLAEKIDFANQYPSAESIASVLDQAEIVKSSAAAVFQESLFRKSGDEFLVDTTVGILMDGSRQLVQKATDLSSEPEPHNLDFSEGFQEIAVLILLEDKDETVVVDDDENEIPSPENIKSVLKSAHEWSIDLLTSEFLASPNVVEFLERQKRRQHFRTEALSFGKVILATYIGSRIAQRKKDK